MTEATLRIDKWLWFARFVKSRADAQKLLERGQVTLNDKTVTKHSASVKIGDALTITIGPTRHTVSVVALGTRRGPAQEAQALYERTAPSARLAWEEAAPPLHRHLR
jgi:ribosome-associated heat shock protein Hsp15